MKVSVIIPIYTVPEQYLRECLDSIVSQDMQEMECLLVSDGAPEKEESICKEYCTKDSRFTLIKKEHAGVSAARNFGIARASGNYICFVDADDYLENKDVCSKIYDFSEENNSDVMLWDVSLDYKEKKYMGHIFDEICQILSCEDISKITDLTICPPAKKYFCLPLVTCKAFKKSFLEKNNLKFAEDLTICEDKLFCIQSYSVAKKISYKKEFFYHYRTNTTSAIHSYKPGAFYIYTKFIKKINSSLLDAHIQSIATTYLETFFYCWSVDQLHRDNEKKIFTKACEISTIIKSDEFQKMVHNACFSKIPTLLKIESFFFIRKMSFPFFIHAFKAFLLKSLLLRFYFRFSHHTRNFMANIVLEEKR